MKKRIFCTNENGRDLFYMDVNDYPELNRIWLHFSTGRQPISNPDTERLIRCIEERLVPEELKKEFTLRLFEFIKRIPDVEQVFIPESLLTKEGKYCESSYNVMEDIYKDYIPRNFEPLTEISGYPFEEICGILYLQSKQKEALSLSETKFEDFASNSDRLHNTFKLLKQTDSSYYYVDIKTSEEFIEIYWMISGKKTVLAFFIRKPI